MKIFGIISGIVVLAFITLLALAPTIAETIAFRRFPPAERAAMKARYEAFMNKKVVLPAAALDAPPYSPETRAAAAAFDAAWEKYEKTKMELAELDYRDSSKFDWPAIERGLVELTPLHNAFATLAHRPDYNIGASSCAQVHSEGNLPFFTRFLALQASAKLLRLRVLADARAGRSADALRNAETTVLAARTGPYECLIDQLIGIGIASIGIGGWSEAVRQCDDPALLRETLKSQDRLVGGMNWLSSDLPIEIVDMIGMIREMKRRGIAVEFQDLTGRELAARAMECQYAYLQQYVLPAVKDDPKLAAKAQVNIDNYRKQAALCGGGPADFDSILNRMSGRISAPMLYAIALPNFGEAATRAGVALSNFDLLRIETARKLYRLEKGKTPASNDALVPDYLAQLLPDRHAKKEKSAYRLLGEVTYSIGPDGRDDALAITYDTTNGTLSAGDIALGR